jgi:hypothetical protein
VSTQLPPDCFKQPVRLFCPLALGELEVVLVVLVVLCELLWSGCVGCACCGCCASVDEGLEALPDGLVDPALLPVCANAMLEASIIAKINFLFMSVAPSKFHCPGCRGPCASLRNKSVISG